MEKIKIVCPTCGVSIMVKKESSRMLCPKCGFGIEIDTPKELPVPTVPPLGAVDSSMAEADAKLAYAEGLLEAECYDRAEKAFRNVAVLFPKDYRAHWGIVRSGTRNFTDYTGSDYSADYANAIQLAGEVPARSMKANYGKYLEDRRKTEFERKTEGKINFGASQAKPEDQFVAVPEPEPAPAPVRTPPKKKKNNLSPEERETLEKRMKQMNEVRTSAAKELDDILERYAELKDSHRPSDIDKLSESKSILEWTWFVIFLIPLIVVAVMLFGDALPKWLGLALFVILAAFGAMMLYNLITELNFRKMMKSRKGESEKYYNEACRKYDIQAEKLRGEITYAEEQMATVKKRLEVDNAEQLMYEQQEAEIQEAYAMY